MGANILVVVGILLLLFGGRKLPQLMGIGKGSNEFNQAESDIHKESKNSVE